MTRKSAKTAEVCAKCGGAAYIITEDGALPCECARDIALQEALKRARIPRKFLSKSLEGFAARKPRHKEIVAAMRDFVRRYCAHGPDAPIKGLLLMGREGTGKTHIAVSVLRSLIGHGYRGLYWNVPELFLELRRMMNDRDAEGTEADLFDDARSADLLVLDDLGAEKTSDYVTDRIYVIINGRYEDEKATIITTNRNLDELRNQLGPRITSRICEMCVPIEFPEGDFRLLNLK